ncbi:MAG: flagellar hook protein [Acidimicrobiia bacterium]
MMRSMFAGVSGLRSHQLMMDVVGNNIANVNTIGYKASRVIFQDTLSQIIRAGSDGGGGGTNLIENIGGVNPQQVGLGVRIASTDAVFTQGGSQLTGRATDVAIQGEGFFVVNLAGEQLYTRAGAFGFDARGFLTDSSGAIVQGWMADSSGSIVTSGPIGNIRLELDKVFPPVSTSQVTVGGNLSATAAAGEVSTTNIEVVDSLGTKHTLTFAFTNQSPGTWQLDVTDANGNSLGSQSFTFDSQGKLPPGSTLQVTGWDPGNGAAPMDFTIDFSGMTQFGQPSSPIAINQNGTVAGSLRSLAIADDGTVTGVFSNGKSLQLAKIALATFSNPAGLIKTGENHFRETGAAGSAVIGTPGSGGRGSLAAGTLEMSNVDLAQEFTNLIIAQRGFQANSRIITASDEILQDLVNLKR